MGKYNDKFSKVVTLPSTAIAFTLEVGFTPMKIKVINLDTLKSMEWYYGMPQDSAIVKLPVAATAVIGTATAAEGNTGKAITPTKGGAYTGFGKGDLVVVCTKKGDFATAKVKGFFPDGTVTDEIKTAASASATTIGQGVTLTLTTGDPGEGEENFQVGDSFKMALTPVGVQHIVSSNGLSTDYDKINVISEGVISSSLGKDAICIRIGLNTDVNVLSQKVLVVAE